MDGMGVGDLDGMVTGSVGDTVGEAAAAFVFLLYAPRPFRKLRIFGLLDEMLVGSVSCFTP